jgi:uncharacterized membrane protein
MFRSTNIKIKRKKIFLTTVEARFFMKTGMRILWAWNVSSIVKSLLKLVKKLTRKYIVYYGINNARLRDQINIYVQGLRAYVKKK